MTTADALTRVQKMRDELSMVVFGDDDPQAKDLAALDHVLALVQEKDKEDGAALLPVDPLASPANTEALPDWRNETKPLWREMKDAAESKMLGGFTSEYLREQIIEWAQEVRLMCERHRDRWHSQDAINRALKDALSSIANHPHNSYDHPSNQSSTGSNYGIGCADGHRCAAQAALDQIGSGTPASQEHAGQRAGAQRHADPTTPVSSPDAGGTR